MRKLFSLLIGLFLFNVIAMPQNQNLKKPTLDELIPGGDSYIFTKSIYGLSWWGDICIEPGYKDLNQVNPLTGERSIIASLEEVNAILKQNNLPEISNLFQVSMPWENDKSLLFTHNGNYIKINLANSTAKSLQQIDATAANTDYSILGNAVAYTIENNLFVNNTQVTNNDLGVVAGQSVHRNEFGIDKGTFWSPTGKNLAFYNMDERMVTEYPLVDISTRIATHDPIRYPMAGMKSHEVSVGIYSLNTGKVTYLNTGSSVDRYFTNIQWAPDEASIYLIELNRDQNHAKLCQYDAVSGELINTLYEEQGSKYVEPQQPIVFLPWNASQFIYKSEKDGYKHLYLFNKNGKLLKQLTKGEWVVNSIIGFNQDKKEVIVTGTYFSPLQNNTLAISINSGKVRKLDNGEGVHRPTLSKNGKYIIDRYSSPKVPNEINIVNVKTAKSINLLTAQDPYADYQMPEITVGTIKAADGVTDLYYRLVQSKDIDKTKKHPAIIYVYGGPHAQMIDSSWNYGVRGWDIYMANKGYVVFTIDNRGSDHRGFEFESATFRQLGIIEGMDQVEGTKFLNSLGYVDMNRIGVHGWSFGGHMTTALLLRYPDIFKVGVAGGPVINWEYYEIMYGERYMDTPQSNPEGYNKTNLCNFADQLKGKLLLIHDGHDSTCVPQHTYAFLKACIEARTYPDLFIYPGHAHNVRGRDRVHLHEKITRYFDDNL